MIDFAHFKVPEKTAKELGFEKICAIGEDGEAVLITAGNKNELFRKAKLEKEKGKIVIFEGSSDEMNRNALECKSIDILLSPEKMIKKDGMHSRNSGLNHVLCKLATQNNISIGINFSELLNLENVERAKRIGRIIQNAMLCRKFKTKMFIASFARNPREMRDAYDLNSLLTVLGGTFI